MHENPARASASLLARAKHEAKAVGLVTLYFLCCFSVVLVFEYPASKGNEIGTMQTTDLDDLSSGWGQCLDKSVFQSLKIVAIRVLARIRKRRDAANRITLAASIDQVVVVGAEIGSRGLRMKVIDTKGGFTIWQPAFAAEAVHTYEEHQDSGKPPWQFVSDGSCSTACLNRSSWANSSRSRSSMTPPA